MITGIESYNLVNGSNAVKPNYDLTKRVPYIKLSFLPTGEVVICGELDSNYIYWLSVTSVNDEAVNEQIFNRVAAGGCECVTQEYKARRPIEARLAAAKGGSPAKLTRCTDGRSGWETPFGCWFSDEQAANNGRFFAQGVRRYYNKLLRQCEFREANGAYKTLLQHYAQVIEQIDAQDYTDLVKPIREVLESENYLGASPHEDVRALYFRCMELCGQKYNGYMSAVR